MIADQAYKDLFATKVSLLDLYPTLIELLDLPHPPQTLDGNSLVPLLKNPDTEWDHRVRMTCQMDGVFFESILSNKFRMTRLATGETELYEHDNDPHEFYNLAENPTYSPIIKRLEKHLSFSYQKSWSWLGRSRADSSTNICWLQTPW